MNRRPRSARLFLACAAALATLSAQAVPLAACAVESVQPVTINTSDAPVAGTVRAPRNDVGCVFGVPLDAGGGVTLFRCLVDAPEGDDADPPEDAWSHALLVHRHGQPIQAYRDELMAGAFSAWRLLRADLDGDGAAENVVALWNAQGNGLGVNTWTVHVFAADWRLLDSRDEVLDWGPSSLVQAPPARGGCDLAATSWVEDTSTGKDGIAFEARFLHLVDGRLVEADDRPPLRRRYTFAFQRERTAFFERDPDSYEGDVVAWLRAVQP